MVLRKLYNISIYLLVFSAIFFPLSSFSFIKLFIFSITLSLTLIILVRSGSISLKVILLGSFFISYLFFMVIFSFLNGFYELEILTELKAFTLMFLVIYIFWFGLKRRIIDIRGTLISGILGHIFYVLFKLAVIFMLYKGYLDIVSLKSISRDFVVNFYGNIPRVSINNDLFSFIFIFILLINRKLVDYKILRKALIFLILLNVFVSYNRITIVSLIFMFLIYNLIYNNIKNYKKIFFYIVVAIIIFLLLLKIDQAFINGAINTLLNRFGNEGALSTSEKIKQYNLILEETDLVSYLVGHGMGTFLEDYVRYNEIGFRYGYEAFLGIIFYQFGIIGLAFFMSILFKIFISYKTFNTKRGLLQFIVMVLWVLHSAVNPVFLTFNSAVIIGLLMLSTEECKIDKNSHFRNQRNT